MNIRLTEIEVYYSDIYSLEIYFDILKNGKASLEEVFQSLTRKNSIERMQGNSFLDQVHQDFFDL